MPWNKPNNPYGPAENGNPPKKRKITIYETSVELQCEGCVSENQRNRSVNIRVLEENFDKDGRGEKHKHCSRCMAQTQFKVIVYSNGAIAAYQANRFGANEHSVAFKKLDQRRKQIEVNA